MKHCAICCQDLPEDSFNKNRTSYDGLQGHCRECAAAKRKERTAAQRNVPLFCTSCQQTLPPEKFSKKRTNPLRCIDCRKQHKKEYMKEFQEAHREENAAYLREYRKTHPTKRADDYALKRSLAGRARYAADAALRARIAAEAKERRDNRTPEQREAYRRYMRTFQTTPIQKERRRAAYQQLKMGEEQYAAYRQRSNEARRATGRNRETREDRAKRPEVYRAREHRRRLRERNQTVESFDLASHVRFLRVWQQEACYYCNRPFGPATQDTHVEHIVPVARDGAHAAFNIVLSCPECNMRKGGKILWKEWRPKVQEARSLFLDVPELEGTPARIISTFQISDRATMNSTLALMEQKAKDPEAMLFFDWEWAQRREAVLSMVASRLRQHKPISAHKLDIIELPSEAAKAFLEKYHLQGFTSSSVYLGLTQGDDILGVSAFRIGQAQIEFTRMAFRGCILGGLSKMFKYFAARYNPENLPILSYSDTRYASGKTAEGVGFACMGDTLPHPGYVGPAGLFHRMTFMKRDMKDFLAYYDPQATEYENARFNGYYRLAGLPLRRYVWTPETVA